MEHYDFHKDFRDLYEKAIRQQKLGVARQDFFARHELAFLSRIGSRAQDLFDYADDAIDYGEPDFETALMVQSVRRNYLNIVQGGVPSKTVIDATTLPAKTAEVRGIAWLPRLIEKSRAKLRGELPESLMFGCSGDRQFFKQYDLHPAEFLQVVWACGESTERIVEYVETRVKK